MMAMTMIGTAMQVAMMMISHMGITITSRIARTTSVQSALSPMMLPCEQTCRSDQETGTQTKRRSTMRTSDLAKVIGTGTTSAALACHSWLMAWTSPASWASRSATWP